MTSVSEDRARLIHDDPFCAHLGIELVDLGAGSARTELEIAPQHCNFHGIPHGAATYALADAAFAAASNAEGSDAFALETNMSYLDRVEVGTTLHAVATRTHESRRTGEYEVVVTDEDDTRIATFRGRVYKPGA